MQKIGAIQNSGPLAISGGVPDTDAKMRAVVTTSGVSGEAAISFYADDVLLGVQVFFESGVASEISGLGNEYGSFTLFFDRIRLIADTDRPWAWEWRVYDTGETTIPLANRHVREQVPRPLAVNERGEVILDQSFKNCTPLLLVSEQDLTDAYASFGDIDTSDAVKLGLLVAADCNASEDVDLKLMGKLDADDTPFDLDEFSAETLWSGSGTNFEKLYVFSGLFPPIIQVQAYAGTVGAVAAFLTGGGSATSVVATWNAVSDGEFSIPIDTVSYDITGLDFSLCGDMDAVAAVIQAGIRAATGETETCVWDTDHFIITSSIATELSGVGVTLAVSGGTGTDISGNGATDFMDCEAGTPTAVVLAGDLTITTLLR